MRLAPPLLLEEWFDDDDEDVRDDSRCKDKSFALSISSSWSPLKRGASSVVRRFRGTGPSNTAGERVPRRGRSLGDRVPVGSGCMPTNQGAECG